jgi:hypothetical protein
VMVSYLKISDLIQDQNINSHHSTAQPSAAQHSTAQRSAAQHSTAQHSTAQRSAAQFPIRFVSCLFSSIECLDIIPSWCRQVDWGNCGIPWVNCAVLRVNDDWKGQSWGLRYFLSKLRSLLSCSVRCNRNEYQKYFLEGKGGRCVGLTNLRPSCTDGLEIWEPQPPWILWACNGFALPLPLLYDVTQ